NQTLVQRVLVDRSAMPIIADLAFDASAYPSEPWKITMPRRDLGDVLNLNSRDYTRAARVLPPSDTSSTDVLISDALDMARAHIGSSELGIRLNVPARSLHR